MSALPDLSRLARTLAEMVENTGDDIHLTLGLTDNGTCKAAIVSPMFGSGFMPLFDPLDGAHALEALGGTPIEALENLALKVAAFDMG